MLSVVLVERPKPLVSLADAKKWLNVEFDEDDALILHAIDAASAEIDGPGGWLGVALGLQTLEQREARFQPAIRLEFPPIRSIEFVQYTDIDGAEVVIEASTYRLENRSLVPASTWPRSARPRSIVIRYIAGYPLEGAGDDARSRIPADVKQAVLRKVARLYEQRGDMRPSSIAEDSVADELLSAHRDWSFP